MSKYSDLDYNLGNCSSCQPSCDPIDININVTCCPSDNGDSGDCCCGEGIHEALQFLGNSIIATHIEEIDIFGINPTALINDAKIVDLFPYEPDITDIVRVQQGTGNIYDIATCVIYSVDISLDVTAEELDAIKTLLNETFNPQNTPSCCCRVGIVRALSANIGNEIALALNNTDSDLNDIMGSIVAVSNDVVWLDTSIGGNERLTVASLCYALAIRQILP